MFTLGKWVVFCSQRFGMLERVGPSMPNRTRSVFSVGMPQALPWIGFESVNKPVSLCAIDDGILLKRILLPNGEQD